MGYFAASRSFLPFSPAKWRSTALAAAALRLALNASRSAHPVHRLRAPQTALLEPRQDVAREQFVGALRRLPIGPVMRQHQDAAEAAGLGPVVLQHPQRIVGRADGAAPAGIDLLDARHADSGAALGIDRIRIELPLLKPSADVLDRLLARLGD